MHIGCSKRSKTSKIHIYSFMGALFLIQMLEAGTLPAELLEGAGFEEIKQAVPGQKFHEVVVPEQQAAAPDDWVVYDKTGQEAAEEAELHNDNRDVRLKVAAELIAASKQPLKPGIFAHLDRLFCEADKPITSMPSHHNFNRLFTVLNEVHSELVQQPEEAKHLRDSRLSALSSTSKPLDNINRTMSTQEALPKYEPIWQRGSSLDLVFRLVMFFNSLPSYIAKQKPIVEMRSFERQKFCSPQVFKLMAALKSADFRSRNIFGRAEVLRRAQESMKSDYLRQAQTW